MAREDELGLEAIKRRLSGQMDSRGMVGIQSRGANVYNGGSNAAVQGRMNPASLGSFNNRFHDKARGLMARRSQLGSDEEYQGRRINEGYNSAIEGYDKIRDQQLVSNNERMANQGILRSGINLAQQGEIGNEYQGNVDAAASGRARSLEDVARAILGGHQGIENEWEGLERESTEWEAEQARIRAEEEARRVAAERAAEEQRLAVEAQIAAAQPRADNAGAYRPAAPMSAQRAAPAPTRPSYAAPKAAAPRPPVQAAARKVSAPSQPKPTYKASAVSGTQSNNKSVAYTTTRKKTSGGRIVL